MYGLIFCNFLILAATMVHADKIGGPAKFTSGLGKLPHCVSDAKQVDEIKGIISANSKTLHKYNGYRQALQSDSDAEIFARLVYAETSAANCPAVSKEIAPRIAAVIGNRVRARGGEVRSVVFQRDQFASSLNIYSESRFADFLCPKDEKLWAAALAVAGLELSGGAGMMAKDTFNYFLYKHSPKWTKEPWTLREDEAGARADVRECIRFFHAPGWK